MTRGLLSKKEEVSSNPLLRVLPATVADSGTALGRVVSRFDGSVRKFVRHLLSLSNTLCVRKCKTACTEHAKSILCKGRAGFGLGIFVFSYDQRIPNAQWDDCTVLCRGLVIVTRLQHDMPNGAFLEHSALQAVLDDETQPLHVAECMPKFWEYGAGRGEISWKDVEICFGRDPGAVRVMRVMEKVDGNLGLIHPARDPASLEAMYDAFPLLATKSVGWSKDIETQHAMLKEQHPNLQLPPGMTSAIVEIVSTTHRVCVPYKYEGFRLLAAVKDGAWLSESELDATAEGWGMRRPTTHPLPEPDSDPGCCMDQIKQRAVDFVLQEGTELVEGFVVQLCNGLRLKVHTSAWNTINGWWAGEISASSVVPLLVDPRLQAAPLSAVEQSVVGGKDERVAARKVRSLRTGVAVARKVLGECTDEVRSALKATAGRRLKVLRGHALYGALQHVRGWRRWTEAVPAEVDLDALEIEFASVRSMFEGRVRAAEAEAQLAMDVEAVADVDTKTLKRVLLCAEDMAAGSKVEALEATLGLTVPEAVLDLVVEKRRVLNTQEHRRLQRVLDRRETADPDS